MDLRPALLQDGSSGAFSVRLGMPRHPAPCTEKLRSSWPLWYEITIGLLRRYDVSKSNESYIYLYEIINQQIKFKTFEQLYCFHSWRTLTNAVA